MTAFQRDAAYFSQPDSRGDQNWARKSSRIVSGGGPLREEEHSDGGECIVTQRDRKTKDRVSEATCKTFRGYTQVTNKRFGTMTKLYGNDSVRFRNAISAMRGTKEPTLETDRWYDEDKGFSPTRKSEMARLRKK